MGTPRYSFDAINALSLQDTGHFIFLSSWAVSLLGSMLSQERPFYLWMNDQNPLTESQIDDLDAQLSAAQGQLMQSLVGLIMPVCTADLPDGTLLCDGSSHSRDDYPNLYDALDTHYHLSASTFFVPDLTDRFVLGAGSTHAKNTTGGAFEHTQVEAEMPTHSHTSPPHTHTEIAAVGTLVTVGLELPTPAAVPSPSVTGAAIVTIDPSGGGAAMDITPPYYALKYVVVAL